ncbi:murein hydrolase activator EnvC family protein [Desulfovibrio ferrophilus]|uniref:Peptidase M23 n=1 Tax=Desulfovibrio ferrophilus TaxID=241368 RepID=A0A2Z6AXQ9_9BACT|nr:peptidoglycan DD-metalloendopeptidase family protein [Desulfovibrio ferrophilus]BBD08037.1 peptidase M23 [Desulfovibrio ferrophilus]
MRDIPYISLPSFMPVAPPPALQLLILAALLLSASLILPANTMASNKAAIEDSLRTGEAQAQQNRKALTRLTQEERSLHGNLAKVEDSLDALRREIRTQERALDRIDSELAGARTTHQQLENTQQASWQELGKLVRALWPLRVAAHRGRTEGGDSWEEADRKFAWGSALYADARRTLKDIESRSELIRTSIKHQEELRAQAEKRLATINGDKDNLLTHRLDFVRGIRKVRAERINAEQALNQVLAAVKDMEYRLKNLSAGQFSDLKGSLPNPVHGKPVGAARGRTGAGFSTAENAPVTAVYWGKVVHNDVLRGFGRVVILYHGDDYYTLYAFLGESHVAIGQEMEKGEPLGTAGYYPVAKGPGLYFELRLGQKAINPVLWLVGRS